MLGRLCHRNSALKKANREEYIYFHSGQNEVKKFRKINGKFREIYKNGLVHDQQVKKLVKSQIWIDFTKNSHCDFSAHFLCT